ncbi:MAG: NAD-dependent epimerase/dehydratase family protein [Thermodesulfobacteriota bacterium]|nr:NAD-dependent epimerase/dehydratase family protein [Thermodesulfobacteriota bacterium]
MSRTVVITGATGFIGGMLVKRLSSTGWHIRALVRAASLGKRSKDVDPEWVTGDLGDRESLKRLVAGADAIVHCAGAVRGAGQDDFDRINVGGVARLVQVAAAQNPKPQFLLLSSLAAREPHLSFYAASKRNGEKALVSHSGNMFWGVFRPPAVYGPGDREMLPLFQGMFRGIAPLIGSDQNRLSLLYVGDLVDAIISWLDNGKKSHRVYELHDGHRSGYSWQEIIDIVERLNGKSVLRANIPVSFVKLVASVNLMAARIFGGSPMLTPGKVRELVHANWVADNDQLSSETGWVPKVLLEEGLRQTFKI